MTRERRQQARTIPSELGFIQISGDEGGRIVDISEAGLRFETFAPIERQRRLQFWFSLNLRERVEASGRLAWLDAAGKVGGLRFLDLSARALRHLRSYVDANPGEPLERPSRKLAALLSALPKDRGRQEEKQTNGTVFFAALAAERARRVRATNYDLGNATVLRKAHSGPRNSGDTSGFERAAEHPALNFYSSQDATGMVSLEWHLMDTRRQLKRGLLLGALVSLILTIAGTSYFVRKPRSSGGRVSPTVPALQAVAPETQASSGASETRAIRPAKETGTTEPRGVDAKPPKKSNATPEQLWAAVQKGNTTAAVELADRFLRGDGVPVNCEQAHVLLLVASEKNNSDATKKLAELEKTGCPKP